MQTITIRGAREHNLKNIDIELPRNNFIVISGISGSGKSSLAFDTIFAEGQRRYVESLSSYARQFLGRMDKPDIDYIEGLSPAISIEQKSTNRNPRSTVGTITEIYDYYRLLFARIGIPHDPKSGQPITKQTVDEIIDAVLIHPEGTRMTILAPVVRARKGEHHKVLKDARSAGFRRARINGKMVLLEDEISLDKKRKHTIDIVVDRIRVEGKHRRRIAEAVEAGLEISDGLLSTLITEDKQSHEHFYSQKYAYPDSDLAFPELEPRLFSFNSPYGACPDCSGLGITLEFDPNLIMPDPTLSFNQGGLVPYNPKAAWNRSRFESLAHDLSFNLDTPLQELPSSAMEAILHGTKHTIDFSYTNRERTGRFEYRSPFRGVLSDLKRRYTETSSESVKQWLEGYMSKRQCETCQGLRLRPEALAVLIEQQSIATLSQMSVERNLQFFRSLKLSDNERQITAEILKEIIARLTFMEKVGLGYLSINRAAATLSGGEAQRIRLATQIGSSLVGVLYILDEPTIGLHQRDNSRLLETLKHLRDIGNTLIVVEHDEQTIRSADWIVELGPGAGLHGGEIVAQGSVADVEGNARSLTGQHLTGKLGLAIPKQRRAASNQKFIEVFGAREHNLQSIDVAFPVGALSVITGVSGSGKSTLLRDVLCPALYNRLNHGQHTEGTYERITGVSHINKIIDIDQNPIGRTPRSNPATYVGMFTPIREMFSTIPESRSRGYKAGRFSFNVAGGRCEKCQGSGSLKIEMHFLPDVYITCDVCHGCRFNHETLEVLYKGRNISQVLDMSVEEAASFFANVPQISRRLDMLMAVGLGYICLGQSAITLSGGEAQRIKLSLELSRRSTGDTLYVLDEPTTGLHMADVLKLMEVINILVDRGNTVVIIEHNLDVILQADHIIDLGPEGGDKGGQLVAAGTPEEVAQCPASHTGRFIASRLKTDP